MSAIIKEMLRAAERIGSISGRLPSHAVMSGALARSIPKAWFPIPSWSGLTVLLCDQCVDPIVLPAGETAFDCGACKHCRARRVAAPKEGA